MKLLLKLGMLALLVVLGFDGVAVTKTYYGADTEAGDVARAATETFGQTKDTQKAYDAAVAALSQQDDVIETKTFVFTDKGAVTLRLHRTAQTLLLSRVEPHWTEITVTGTANNPS